MTDAGSRLRLENEKLSVVILPQLGGKIASFYHKDAAFELAAENTLRGYRLPSGPAPSFEDFDASGLDDAFPNIDACVMEWTGKRLCV